MQWLQPLPQTFYVTNSENAVMWFCLMPMAVFRIKVIAFMGLLSLKLLLFTSVPISRLISIDFRWLYL